MKKLWTVHRLCCKKYYTILPPLLWVWGLCYCDPSRRGTELLSFLGSFLPELTARYSPALPCPQRAVASPWLFSCRQYLEQLGIQLFCWLQGPFEWKGDNPFPSSITALCPQLLYRKAVQNRCPENGNLHKVLLFSQEEFLEQCLDALEDGVAVLSCLYIWLWKKIFLCIWAEQEFFSMSRVWIVNLLIGFAV